MLNNKLNFWDYSIFETESFQLPIISSPFVTNYNKYIDKISNDIQEWHKQCCFFKDEIILEEYLTTKPFLFSAYYYCHLNENVLPFIIKFVDMIFIYDDLFLEVDNPNSSIEILNQFFEKDCPNKNIYGTEWFKIVDGLILYGNKNSVELFLKEFKVFMKNAFTFHQRKTNIYIKDLDEYIKIRELDFGFSLIVAAAIIDCEMPSKDIRENKLFQKLNNHSSIICILVNDIYSFIKEKEMNDSMNYVKIMAIKKKSIQKAIDHCQKIIDQRFLTVLSLENQLLSIYKNDLNLEEYLKRLNSVISATIYIHQNHKRYLKYNKNYI